MPAALATIVVAVVIAVALAIGLRARRVAPQTPEPVAPWAQAAGDEFTDLSESQRCDLVFAVGALGDEASQRLLERALDDPSEAVALAAACELARAGRAGIVEAYLAVHPGERAQHIAHTVDLLRS
jgi:HEAT repeat protein